MRHRSSPFLRAALAVALLVPGSAGCGSFVPPATGEAGVRPPGWMERVTDEDIRKALEARHDVALPVRLAVIDERPRWGRGLANRLTESARLRETLEPLIADGLVSELVNVTTPLPSAESFKAAGAFEYLKPHRLAAAQYRADVVAVLTGGGSDERWTNPLGFLYLTVVGLWLAPATRQDSYARVDAVVVDVRDGTVLTAANGESVVGQVRPLCVLDGDGLRAAAGDAAFDDLLTQLHPALTRSLRAAGGLS